MALGFFRGMFRGMRADTGQDHGGGKLVEGAPPGITYFGQQTGNSGDDNSGGYQFTVCVNKTFACPGSGSQVIKELSANVKAIADSPSVKIGIYTTAGVLVAQGTAEVAVTGASYSWQGHLTQASITPNPATLTGGTSYKLAAYMPLGGTTGIQIQTGGASGDMAYNFGIQYSPTLPDPIPGSLTSISTWWNIRCGVEPA